MSASTDITYTPHHEATPAAEISALVNVYKFILESHAQKEAAPESRPDDAKERSKDDSSARHIIQDPK